ncbi:hypothetical protein B0H11DRAFT_1374860 [Mycena galericulata]|nr:hypothetical protein B0H11DRAFT_1374860 [Mycena galericulata]
MMGSALPLLYLAVGSLFANPRNRTHSYIQEIAWHRRSGSLDLTRRQRHSWSIEIVVLRLEVLPLGPVGVESRKDDEIDCRATFQIRPRGTPHHHHTNDSLHNNSDLELNCSAIQDRGGKLRKRGRS